MTCFVNSYISTSLRPEMTKDTFEVQVLTQLESPPINCGYYFYRTNNDTLDIRILKKSLDLRDGDLMPRMFQFCFFFLIFFCQPRMFQSFSHFYVLKIFKFGGHGN